MFKAVYKNEGKKKLNIIRNINHPINWSVTKNAPQLGLSAEILSTPQQF